MEAEGPRAPIASRIGSKYTANLLLSGLECWSVVCVASLMSLTYRLWLPVQCRDLPQIPLIQLLVAADPKWDILSLGILSAGLAGLFISSGRIVIKSCVRIKGGSSVDSRAFLKQSKNRPWFESLSLLLIFGGGLSMVLLDQLRLQAWFYHLLLFSLALTLPSANSRLKWLQVLVISIYAYSALGKLDYQFLHTTGQDLLVAAGRPFGLDWQGANWSLRVTLASLFPLCELMLAAGLCFTRFRRLTGWACCLFHLTLLWLLGWQLGHSWGVLLWNLQFAVQAVFLFAMPVVHRDVSGFQTQQPEGPTSNSGPSLNCQSVSAKASGYLIRTCLTLAILLPITDRFGWWDHWPSWALYAPHGDRAKVWVAPHAVERLPISLRQVVEVSRKVQLQSDTTIGVEIPLAAWSLEALQVPVYPQARYQLGLVRYLSQIVDEQYAVRAEIQGVSKRLDGKRTIQSVHGTSQIQLAAERFWLNSQPR